MNKRKPDDEFACINLSYFKASGEEVIVYCPESKEATATQEPARQRLNELEVPPAEVVAVAPATQDPVAAENASTPTPAPTKPSTSVMEAVVAEIKEQHFTMIPGIATNRSSAPIFVAQSPLSLKTRTSSFSIRSRILSASARPF